MEIAALGSLALVGAGAIGLGISHKKARRKQKERALTSHSNAKPLCSNIQTYSFSSPNSSPHGQCVNVTNGAGTVAYTFQKITPNIPGRFAKWGMMDNTSNRQIATVNMSPLDTHMEVEDIVRKIVRKIQVKMKKKGAYRQFEVSNCEGNVNALANIPPSVYRWNTYSYHLERILNAACAVYPSPDVPKPYMIPPQTSTVNTVEIVGRARNLNCESFNCQLDLDPKKVDTRCALASAFMNILSSWKRQRKEKAAFKKAKFKKFKIFSKMNIFSKKNKGRCEVSIQQLQPCYIHNQCASPGQPCQFCPLLRKLKYTKKKHLKKLTKTKGFLPCSKNEPNYCNTQGTQCNNESQNSRFPYTQINLLGGQITMDQSNGLEPENTYRVIQPQCYNNNNNVNTNNDNTMLEDTMCSNVPIAYQPITPQIQYPIQPQPNITVNIDSCSEENCKKCKRHSENTKKKNKISELSNSMVTPSQDKQTFSSSKPSKREKAFFKKSKLSTLEAGLKSTGKSLFHKRNDSVTSLSTLGSSINSQSYMSSRPNSSYSITSSLISKESRSCPSSAGSLLKKFRGNKLKRKLREKKNMLKSRSKSCRHRSKKSHQNSNGSCSSLNSGSHSKRVSFDRKRHYHYPKSYSSFKHRNHLEESPSFRVSKSSSSQCSIKSPKFFNKSKKYFTGCQNPDQKPSYSRQHTTETLGHSIDPFCNPIMQHPLPYNDSHRPLYVRSQIGTENPQYYVQPLGKGGPNPDTYMNQQQFSQYVPQTQNSNFRQRQEFSKAGIPSNQFNVQNLTSQAAIPNSEAYIPMNRYSKIAIKGHNYHHSPKTGQYANPIQKSKQSQHVSFKPSASQREQSEMGYVQNSLGLGSKNPFNDNIRENRNFSMSQQFATSQLNLSCSSSDYTDIKSSNCSAESIPVGGVYYAATSPRPCSSSSSKYSSILTKEGQDFFFEPAVNIKNKSRTESFEQFNMEESSFRSPSLQGKSHVAINDQVAQHNKQHMMLQQMEFKNALRKKQANDMKQQDLYKRQIELEKKLKKSMN